MTVSATERRRRALSRSTAGVALEKDSALWRERWCWMGKSCRSSAARGGVEAFVSSRRFITREYLYIHTQSSVLDNLTPEIPHRDSSTGRKGYTRLLSFSLSLSPSSLSRLTATFSSVCSRRSSRSGSLLKTTNTSLRLPKTKTRQLPLLQRTSANRPSTRGRLNVRLVFFLPHPVLF
jgi:hypothetical protein